MLKAFRVDMKAFLGLVLPHQLDTASLSSGKIKAGFWVILFRGPRLLLFVVPTTIQLYYRTV